MLKFKKPPENILKPEKKKATPRQVNILANTNAAQNKRVKKNRVRNAIAKASRARNFK